MAVMDSYEIRAEFSNTIAYTPTDVALVRAMNRSYPCNVGCTDTDDGDCSTALLAVTHLAATWLHAGAFTRSIEKFGVGDEMSQTNFRPFRGISLTESTTLYRHRQRIM